MRCWCNALFNEYRVILETALDKNLLFYKEVMFEKQVFSYLCMDQETNINEK